MEIAYVAGLFDGEGYVRAQKITRPLPSEYIAWQVYIGIGMTHAQVIEKLQRQFGGSLTINDHSKRNINHRPQFFWKTSSQKACAMLRQILPFLIVKREEVELALELQASIDAHKFKLGNQFWKHKDHTAIFAYRESIADRISALKHRNFSLSVVSPILT